MTLITFSVFQQQFSSVIFSINDVIRRVTLDTSLFLLRLFHRAATLIEFHPGSSKSALLP